MASTQTAATETKRMNRIDARERLIVALDLENAEQAQAMVRQLEGVVDFFKIGLTLQLARGVEALIWDLVKVQHKKLFLDYKYYDIPATLTKAVARAAELGVSFLTIHGTGQCIAGAIKGRGDSDLKIFVVTVLTNMDEDDIKELGYTQHTIADLVLHRAKKALEAKCDGVIASGLEAEMIKKLTANRLLVVTPGIRPDGSPIGDQKRVMTPREAIKAGADYLVIGRPITEHLGFSNPREAAQAILAEMQSAFDENQAGENQAIEA